MSKLIHPSTPLRMTDYLPRKKNYKIQLENKKPSTLPLKKGR